MSLATRKRLKGLVYTLIVKLRFATVACTFHPRKLMNTFDIFCAELPFDICSPIASENATVTQRKVFAADKSKFST